MSPTSTIRVALIIGSTRPNRFADIPARWITAAAGARKDFALETLDLRDQDLQFYAEPATPLTTGGAYSNAAAERWRKVIGGFDAYIVTAAEYNHGPTAVLKNALDSAHYEWNNKPIAFVGYGGVGGARAVEQLRMIAVELQMVPIRNAVHIGLEPYLGVIKEGRTLDSYPYLTQARDGLFDQLVWWARALKTARESTRAAA